MATLEQVVQYTISLTGEAQRRIGAKNTPTNLTVTGQVFDTGNVPLADGFAQLTLWQANQGGLATFAYLLFLCTADCWLEFANTVPATDERAIVRVPANAMLVIPSAFMGGYASNTSRLDGADLVLATDYNSINEIRVQSDVALLGGAGLARMMLIL